LRALSDAGSEDFSFFFAARRAFSVARRHAPKLSKFCCCHISMGGRKGSILSMLVVPTVVPCRGSALPRELLLLSESG
jgi:hypothetical protein